MTYDVGDTAVLNCSVTPADGTTNATVIVIAPDGTISAPAATTADVGATWIAQASVTMSGRWSVQWTVTGTGQAVQYDSFDADPIPPATDDQRRVRLLIVDTDPANRLFSTLQIDDFLALNNGSVRRAAAQALDAIAANEALISKKITTQDLSTDGPAVARELRALATSLRAQADAGDGDAESTGFEVVEFELYPCRPGWPY